MDTILIRKLLRNFKCFKGVYPCDLLPYNTKLPLNLIVNTDPSDMPGEHWVCISISSNGRGEYFDSFGLPPLRKEIFNYLEKMCSNGWTYNKVTLQNIQSQTCGHYSVLYIIFKCQGLSKENLIRKFNKNTLENDRKIEEIFKDFKLAKLNM